MISTIRRGLAWLRARAAAPIPPPPMRPRPRTVEEALSGDVEKIGGDLARAIDGEVTQASPETRRLLLAMTARWSAKSNVPSADPWLDEPADADLKAALAAAAEETGEPF